MKKRILTLFSLFLFFLLSSGFPPGQIRADSFAERYFRLGMDLLKAGQLDEAAKNFYLVLERDERHLDAIDKLAEVYASKGDRDSALYYLSLYVNTGKRLEGLSREQSRRLRELERRVAKEDPLKRSVDGFLRSYLERLFSDISLYQKRKLFQQAVKILLEILRIYPGEEKATAFLKEIRLKGTAEVALVDFTAGEDPTRNKTSEWIEENDKLHSEWKKCWEEKTDNYSIQTNAGYMVLRTTAIVMEQMHKFYQEVYRYPKKGGKTPRIFVKIFKNRKEFEDYAPEPLREAGGYFAGSEIATYDMTGEGRPSRALYSTLFHEASHQFLSYVVSGVPTWLNEGLATFFEACLILSNKKVLTNQINSGRLMGLVSHLKGDSPYSLHEILTTPPGLKNYTGTHYNYGWGIIYYFYNFEDEDGNFVYRDLLDAYLKSFKKGRPADQVEHFLESFNLGKKGCPSTLEEMEKEWKEYIFRVHQVYLGKIDLSAEYFAKAESFLQGKDLEKAERYLRRVLDIKPDHPESLYHMGKIEDEKKEKDQALDFYSRYLIYADPGDAKRKEEVASRMAVLDPLAKGRLEASDRFREKVMSAAKEYEKEGLILRAMDTAEKVFVLFPRDHQARSYIEDLESRTGRSTTRWRLVFNEQDLEGWYTGADNDAFSVENGELVADFKSKLDEDGMEVNYRLIFCDRDFERNYSFSADIKEDEPTYIMGICFGAKSLTQFKAIVLAPPDQVNVNRFDGRWHIEKPIMLELDQSIQGWTNLRIDVLRGMFTVFLNGKKVVESRCPEGELWGDIGLVIGNGKARFKNIKYLGRD